MLFQGAAVIAIFLLPFVVGGRHAAGHAILSIAAIIACLAWLVRMLRVSEPSWTAGFGEWFFAAGVAIANAQVVTMPPGILDTVSPRLHELLPAYSGGPWSLGIWRTLSLTPGETSVGISILIAQGILALIVFQFAGSTEAIERMLVLVVGAAALLALHGLIQFVGHEGRSFDVAMVSFHEEGGIVKAMFRNRNDFAGFLAIAAGPAVWCAFRRSESDAVRITIGLGVLGLVSLAVCASLARGGSIALAVGTAVACGMLVRSGHLRPRMGLAILAAAAIVAIALHIQGMEQFTTRMETLLDDGHQEKAFGRREVWQAAWRTISDFPLTGTGIGSHGDMARIEMPSTGPVHYVHAESSYLNLAVETGLPGLMVAILAMGVALAAAMTVFFRAAPREQAIAAAITAGLVAGAAHGIGHFNWYAPAISTLLIVLGVCGIRMAVPGSGWMPCVRIPVDRSLAMVVATAAMLMLGVIAFRQITAALVEPAWDEAVRLARTQGRDGRALLDAEAAVAIDAAKQLTRATEQPEESLREAAESVAERRRSLLDGLERRLALLDRVVADRPDHPRAWAEIAVVRCERFDLVRSMAGEAIMLEDIRQTAITGGFPTRDACGEWLRRIAGDHFDDLVHAYDAAKRAVMQTPCAGDAWCVLGRLAFLESSDPELARRCIDQALVVQPNEGIVLFTAALQAASDGQQDLATTRWRKLFAVAPHQREMTANLLRPRMSADEALAMLDPDLDGLRVIDAVWSRQSSAEDMRTVRERRLAAALAAAEDAREPAWSARRGRLLREAAALQRTLGRHDQAADVLTMAIEADPAHHGARLARIDLAIALDDPATARQHLDWLLLRRPDAKAVTDRVSRLEQLRARLASVRETAANPEDVFSLPRGTRQ
jgi:O-antigen ligase/tetratricopeptide (TPR) repeat protein